MASWGMEAVEQHGELQISDPVSQLVLGSIATASSVDTHLDI